MYFTAEEIERMREATAAHGDTARRACYQCGKQAVVRCSDGRNLCLECSGPKEATA